MVTYKLVGADGSSINIKDFCFRGTFSETPYSYLQQTWTDNDEEYPSYLDDDDEDEDNDPRLLGLFEDLQENATEIVWYLETDSVSSNIQEIHANVPWIRDYSVLSLEDKSLTVKTDIPADHVFHILSSLRNIRDYNGPTYEYYRAQKLTPYDAFFMTMFLYQSEDYTGETVLQRFEGVNDYMWVCCDTISKASTKHLYESGPSFRLQTGMPYKTHCGESDCALFIPGIPLLDEWEEDVEDPRYYMFYSFELDGREASHKPLPSSATKLETYLKSLLKGK